MALSRLSNCFNRVVPALARCLHRECVDVYGLRINTIQTGRGPRALLLMPGAIGTALTDFRKQIELLPAMLPDFKIIAWDPPGAGASQAIKPTCFSNMFVDNAYAAFDLMQALNIPFFSVMGWSAGGTTALVLAGRFPRFIDRVVVWGSTAYFSMSDLRKLKAMRNSRTKDGSGTNHIMLEKLYGQDRFCKMWCDHVVNVANIINAREGDFCKKEVNCMQAPTLILHGHRDPIILKHHVDYLKKHIKQSRLLEIPEGGHDIHIQHEHKFNKIVARFLKEENA